MPWGGHIYCSTCRIQQTLQETNRRDTSSLMTSSNDRSGSLNDLVQLGSLLGIIQAENIKTKQRELEIREREVELLEKQLKRQLKQLNKIKRPKVETLSTVSAKIPVSESVAKYTESPVTNAISTDSIVVNTETNTTKTVLEKEPDAKPSISEQQTDKILKYVQAQQQQDFMYYKKKTKSIDFGTIFFTAVILAVIAFSAFMK